MEIMNQERTAYLLNLEGIGALVEEAKQYLGREFDDYDSPQTADALIHVIQRKDLKEISLSEFIDIFRSLKNTGRIRSNEERAEERAEALKAERTDRQAEADRRAAEEVARPSEQETFYAGKSASEIRERIKRDPAFAKFARNRMESEMGADVKPTTTVSVEAHPALRRFALAYQTAPASSLKPIGGYVTLGGERFTIQKFDQLLAEASEKKLI